MVNATFSEPWGFCTNGSVGILSCCTPTPTPTLSFQINAACTPVLDSLQLTPGATVACESESSYAVTQVELPILFRGVDYKQLYLARVLLAASVCRTRYILVTSRGSGTTAMYP